jgi:dihydrofolate reductase
LIAALARNRVIGAGNRMPWHLPEDLRFFKATTLGHPVIMGRKTYASIGRALPGRRNVVVSRQANLQIDGVEIAHSLEAAVALCAEATEVFVIGVGELYALSLPLATRMVLTEIDTELAGDTYFPAWDPTQWKEVTRQLGPTDAALRFSFVDYCRTQSTK